MRGSRSTAKSGRSKAAVPWGFGLGGHCRRALADGTAWASLCFMFNSPRDQFSGPWLFSTAEARTSNSSSSCLIHHHHRAGGCLPVFFAALAGLRLIRHRPNQCTMAINQMKPYIWQLTICPLELFGTQTPCYGATTTGAKATFARPPVLVSELAVPGCGCRPGWRYSYSYSCIKRLFWQRAQEIVLSHRPCR